MYKPIFLGLMPARIRESRKSLALFIPVVIPKLEAKLAERRM